MSAYEKKPWGVGTASAPMVTVGLGNSMRDLTIEEVHEFMKDLARGYYQVAGTLPPAIRRADVGAASRTMTKERIEKAKAGSSAWARRRLRLVQGGR